MKQDNGGITEKIKGPQKMDLKYWDCEASVKGYNPGLSIIHNKEERMKYLLCLLLGWLSLSQGIAMPSPTIEAQLRLQGLKAIQTTEKSGDELYLMVTVFHPNKRQAEYVILPPKPFFWRSKDLDKITETTLWKQRLQEGQGVTIWISLVEKDLAPWDVDDLIGSLILHLKNDKGKIISQWDMGKKAEGPKELMFGHSKIQSFDLEGHSGHYSVKLDLNLIKK